MTATIRGTIIGAAFLACTVFANYAVAHIGTPTGPGGPHVLPVGFGITAPSGVYVVGVTLVLRDLVQRQVGKLATLALILAGAALTFTFSPSLAVASGIAFLLSESADFAVFSLTERFGLVVAAAASNAVSVVVDSLIFLTIAFGSLAFVEGQIVGKAWATVVGIAFLAALHARENRRAATA